ncbi:MAG: hypothetical protein Q9218_003433 [Villophora microphyllina]
MGAALSLSRNSERHLLPDVHAEQSSNLSTAQQQVVTGHQPDHGAIVEEPAVSIPCKKIVPTPKPLLQAISQLYPVPTPQNLVTEAQKLRAEQLDREGKSPLSTNSYHTH